jgi:hypothetical protein
VFVSLDEEGRPTPHGYHDITYDRDRFTPARHPARSSHHRTLAPLVLVQSRHRLGPQAGRASVET